jgi:cysteine desulfurase/selenocysteine lyase
LSTSNPNARDPYGGSPPRGGFDVQAVRADFPVLDRQINGKPLVFLDSAASSQKPLPVIEAISSYYRSSHANVHRGIYRLSEEATDAFENARSRIARFINAESSKEVIFTRNATESINLVANSWGRANLRPGDVREPQSNDEILLTEMEHHANLVPWQLIAQEKGARLRFIPITEDGQLDLSGLDDLLTERTKLVAFTQASNVLGTLTPVRQIVDAAHAVGAVALVDGAQGAPHLPVDVQAIGCDFYVFSSHKMCGPTGVGVLWGRRELLEAMPPFMGGGEMIRRVELERSAWAGLPHKFEAGTPAIAEAIGLGAAVDYLSALGMEAVRAHEKELTTYALERLVEVPGLTIYGPTDVEVRGGVATFTLNGVHPHDVATILDSEAVAVRAGHHCAMPLHNRLGLSATTRASFYIYNVPGEIDRLVEALYKVKHIFSRGRV